MARHSVLLYSPLNWLTLLSHVKKPWQYWAEMLTIKSKEKDLAMKRRTSSLALVREKGNYTQHRSKRTMHNINMTEHAIQFWRASFSFEETVQTLDYETRSPRFWKPSNATA